MIYFPPSPTVGQQYVGVNGVTYTWMGDRWNGVNALEQGQADYFIDGGDASFNYNAVRDGILDDGVADNSSGITITSDTLSNSYGNSSGTVYYNITNAGASSAGVILQGVTTGYSQTFTGTYNQGSNSIEFEAEYQLWNHVVNVIAFVVDSRGYTFYSDPILWDVPTGPCLVEGTLITMADGTQKPIEDITHGELIRVWNFDLGEFSEAQPIWVKVPEETNGRNVFTFSDGTVLHTVGHHVFNKQAGKFTYLIKDETPVGTVTFNERGEEVVLISKEIIYDIPTRFYNVWTQYHLNLFANGILTSNRFNNTYPIVDMKFVKDDRKLIDIGKFDGIDEKYITGLRLQEQTYDVEYMKNYVINRIERLDIANTAEKIK